MTAVSPLAMAIGQGYYGAIDLGQSTASRACDSSLQTSMYGGSSNFSCTNKANSYGPSIGYQFNENLAIEAGYVRVGKFSYSFVTSACGGCTIASNEDFSVLRFAVIGYLPSANNFSMFGKAGFNRWSRTSSGSQYLGPFQSSDSGVGSLIGFGAKYDFSQSLAVRFQFETQGVGSSELKKIDMLSVGLIIQ